jgi:hypothetical protein
LSTEARLFYVLNNDSYPPFSVLLWSIFTTGKIAGRIDHGGGFTLSLGERCLEQPGEKQRDGAAAVEHAEVGGRNQVRE